MKLDDMQLQQLLRRESGLQNGAPPVHKTARIQTLLPVAGYLKTHLLICLLAAAFLTGVLAGALLVRNAGTDTLDALQTLLGGYMEQRRSQSIAAMAASTFSSAFVALLILFFCGFCTIAQPIIFLVLLYKGLGYGFAIGMLYLQYGMEAIKFVACLQFPALFCCALLLLFAAKASFFLSIRLLRSTTSQGDPADRYRMRRYCVKFAAYTVLALLIALADAALFYRFGGLLMPA